MRLKNHPLPRALPSRNIGFKRPFHNYHNTVELFMPSSPKPPQPFVPTGFNVPEKLETPEFRIRTLTVNDAVKDYDAVVTSVEHLKTVWPGSNWPQDLTFEQDLIDLGWHQKEFQIRRSFAYTVVTPSESQVVGCVYINPTRRSGFDAEVFLWARQSKLAGGLEERLYRKVQEWLQADWPFKKVAFPGRDIDWPAWRAIPLEAR
jgi:hypothetical protein